MYVCLPSPIHSAYEHYHGRIWTYVCVCVYVMLGCNLSLDLNI